ncbi:hypothetical protein D9M69_534600 [compost metagenome]
MKAWIANLRAALDAELEFLSMSASYATRGGRGYRLLYAWYVAQLPFDLLHRLAMSNQCAMRGHAIEDHSYGGPESGCVDLQCERCGWSHYVTLY